MGDIVKFEPTKPAKPKLVYRDDKPDLDWWSTARDDYSVLLSITGPSSMTGLSMPPHRARALAAELVHWADAVEVGQGELCFEDLGDAS
jgi:hypothetical protein